MLVLYTARARVQSTWNTWLMYTTHHTDIMVVTMYVVMLCLSTACCVLLVGVSYFQISLMHHCGVIVLQVDTLVFGFLVTARARVQSAWNTWLM